MATPAIPAIPDPKPKVSILMRSGLIPMLAAIVGFCVTVRVSSPNRVRFITKRRSPRNMIARQKMAIRMLLIASTSFTAKAPSSQLGAVRGRA